jgi:hypothetical protein
MQRLQFPHQGAFNPDDWPKFLSAVKDSLEKWEFDSGWIANPSVGVATSVRHRMGRTPGFAQLQVSDDSRGSAWQTMEFTSVDDTEVDFLSNSPYIRIIASF